MLDNSKLYDISLPFADVWYACLSTFELSVPMPGQMWREQSWAEQDIETSVLPWTLTVRMNVSPIKNFDNDNIQVLAENLKQLKECLVFLKELYNPVNTNEKAEFVDKIETVIKCLLEIREFLMSDARNTLTSRQYDILTMEEDTVITDPSIQFFGIDWTLLNSRVKILEKKLKAYMKNLKVVKLDVMMLASILKIITQMSTELHQHSIAVVVPKKMEKIPSHNKLSATTSESKPEVRQRKAMPLEKGHCQSEKMRRKSFNVN